MTDEVQADRAGPQNALLKTDRIEQFLRELAVLATKMVSDGLSCGMALRHPGRPALVTASSDSLAAAADDMQYQTGEGPGPDALRHARPDLIDDMAAHHQWIGFCEPAARAGLLSCYALPLIAEGKPIGALILYSRKAFAFGPRETGQADAFADHAAGALTLALRMSSCTDLNDQLKSSLASRAVIDQAVGVIMATEHCSQERAFALLRSVSQNTNVKLRALAADIVTSVSGEPPRPAPPFQDG